MKIKSNLTIPSTFVIVLIFLLPTTNLHSQTVNDSFNGSGSLNSGWWTVQLDNGSNGSVNVISGQCIVVSGNNASNQAEAFTNVQGNQSNQYSLTIKFVSVSGGQNSGTVFGVGSVAELSGSNGPLAKGIQVVKASNNDSFSQNDGVWVEDSIVYHTPPSDGDIVTIIIANGMYIVKYNSNVVASNSLSLSPANDYAAILRARSGGSNGEEGTAIFDDFALTINAQCGETCANACQLSGITGSIDYTTTSSNIDDYSGSNCAGGGGGNPNGNSSDLVYELTTPVSPGDTLTFWTSNDNYDVVLYGRFGSCIGTQIGCIAEPDGTPITWVNNTGTAQNVWFFVDGNSSVGSATLNWQIKSSLPPLCGETCANACQISGMTGNVDYTITSSNTDDYVGSNCIGGGGGNPNGNSSDLVYELITPIPMGYTLTFWTSNDNYDVVLYGRFGSCIGTQIGCIAEPDGTPITWVNNTGTAQNVWFFVDGNSSVGSATLNWQIKSSLPPLCGETCANACQISGMTGNVDYTITSSNTDDYVGSNCIGGGGGNPNGNSSDLVYELITPIPMGNTLIFWTSNDNYDVVLYGRFGSCIGIQIGCIAEPDGTPITWVNNTGTAQNVWFFVDGNDSVGSATLNWDIITGIKELDFKTINLYPNPTDGILNIEYELRKPSPVTLEFYSITGRKIFALNDKETTINHHQISLKELHLQSGVYYLRIGGEDGFVTRKVVLMK